MPHGSHGSRFNLCYVNAKNSVDWIVASGILFCYYRLGRYPVHFHLNGDMEGSYVRGLAIHETFNRAINVHGTHNMLVEHTVIHNVMGGALFLEDGIEQGNRYYVCTPCVNCPDRMECWKGVQKNSTKRGSFPVKILLEVISVFLSCPTKLIKHFAQQGIWWMSHSIKNNFWHEFDNYTSI